jgi:hypothetical protein
MAAACAANTQTLHASCLTSGCSLQAGHNQPAAQALQRGQLTCKDSLLVGWGGAADQDMNSCPVVLASNQGTSVKVQGCTLQYHPDSKHTLDTFVVLARLDARMALSQCRLVGPAPGNTTGRNIGIGSAGTATLVRLWDSIVIVAQVHYSSVIVLCCCGSEQCP